MQGEQMKAGCHMQKSRHAVLAPRERHDAYAATTCAVNLATRFRVSSSSSSSSSSSEAASLGIENSALLQQRVGAHVGQDVDAHLGSIWGRDVRGAEWRERN